MASFNPVELIAAKRDGAELSAAQIHELVGGFMSGKLADYQMSAFLMAAFLRGLSDQETVALTEAMLRSGDVLELASVRAPKVDKHSTGGVGDKISLCLAPLVAACGVAVPMISGRGLGHTGGTLDKLEAIAGYDVRLSAAAFERTVREVGVSMIGQTDRLAPADRSIYALRDVTATVECVPLIVASILSKKLAEGIDGLVLDVKVGRGAFMKDLASARRLARALVKVGRRAGKRVVAVLTDMSSPIGRTIGNALETREAIEVLQDQGPADTRELTLVLGVQMLKLGGSKGSDTDLRKQLEAALRSGAALERFARMVKAHGGDAQMVLHPERLPRARQRVPVLAKRGGRLQGCDPYELGMVSVALGAGRRRAEDPVDPAAGIQLLVKPGDRVEAGQPLAVLHAASKSRATPVLERAAAAFSIGRTRPKLPPLVFERISR
ncbi:MAG TPA: thymidine phosphorylase [Polyangiaceae bacterium]|nr:thymidine phosphorylase [Polyangiaceae bacterium]